MTAQPNSEPDSHKPITLVFAAVPVLELRTPDSNKLLAKLYPADGILELKLDGTWYRLDVRAYLERKPPTKTMSIAAIRP